MDSSWKAPFCFFDNKVILAKKKKEKPSKLKLTFLEITQTRILAPPQKF